MTVLVFQQQVPNDAHEHRDGGPPLLAVHQLSTRFSGFLENNHGSSEVNVILLSQGVKIQHVFQEDIRCTVQLLVVVMSRSPFVVSLNGRNGESLGNLITELTDGKYPRSDGFFPIGFVGHTLCIIG